MSITASTSSLIQGAHDEGILSGASLAALQVPDIGAAINDAIGSNKVEVNASETVHVIMLVDDSMSIAYAWDKDKKARIDHSETVCEGHNTVIESLRGSKARDGIFVTTFLLNGTVINSFTHIDAAHLLVNKTNYAATGGTPLYDQSAVVIGSAIAKTQELANDGIPCRSIILIITDGKDEHSRTTSARDIQRIVEDVLQTEQYIVVGMGIKGADGGLHPVDFKDIFQKMGIMDKWILTPGDSQKEIRAAFQLFSQSATQASQNAGAFSKTALGGFGN